MNFGKCRDLPCREDLTKTQVMGIVENSVYGVGAILGTKSQDTSASFCYAGSIDGISALSV